MSVTPHPFKRINYGTSGIDKEISPVVLSVTHQEAYALMVRWKSLLTYVEGRQFQTDRREYACQGAEDVKVDYTNIVHSCGYRHLLGVKDSRFYFANQDETNTVSMLGPSLHLPPVPIELMDVSGEPKYSQTGNLLSVIEDTGIKYLLWHGNKYKEASMDFNGSPTDTVIAPLDVSFRMTPEMGKDEDNIDRQIIHAYVALRFNKDGVGSFNSHDDIAARNKLFVPKYLEALYRHKEKGYPVGYFFICAVAELYDGTKVLQTNPQLITIGNDKGHATTNVHKVITVV